MSPFSLNRWPASSWVALSLLCLYLIRLSGAPLFDVDEGAFAEASREMLTSGDWGHTTLNGLDRFDKPIFIYWCQAALMGLLGPHDWVARIPSAMAVLAAIAATWKFAANEWGQKAGNRAAFILGTSLGLLFIGRASTADGVLNALLIATGLSLWGFASSSDRSQLRWAYFWCGLGLLTKGPVAILVPGASLVIWSLLTDKGQTAWSAFKEPKGWLILLTVALPWYAYALNRHGMTFVDGFFLKHNVQRFTSTLEGHRGNVLYYITVLPLLLLPWAPWSFRLMRNIRQQWADPLSRFLWIWLLFVLCFFSISGTKLPHYMLYGLCPLVLLIVGQMVSTPLSKSSMMWLAASATITSLLASAMPSLVAFGAEKAPDPWIRGLLSTAPNGFWVELLGVVTVGLGFALRFVKPMDAWSRLAIYVWAVCMLWACIVIPWLGQVLQSPFQTVAMWARTHHPEANVVQWKMHQPSFAFYYGKATPQTPPTPENWIIVREDRTSELALDHYQVAYSHRGLLLLKPTQ